MSHLIHESCFRAPSWEYVGVSDTGKLVAVKDPQSSLYARLRTDLRKVVAVACRVLQDKGTLDYLQQRTDPIEIQNLTNRLTKINNEVKRYNKRFDEARLLPRYINVVELLIRKLFGLFLRIDEFETQCTWETPGVKRKSPEGKQQGTPSPKRPASGRSSASTSHTSWTGLSPEEVKTILTAKCTDLGMSLKENSEKETNLYQAVSDATAMADPLSAKEIQRLAVSYRKANSDWSEGPSCVTSQLKSLVAALNRPILYMQVDPTSGNLSTTRYSFGDAKTGDAKRALIIAHTGSGFAAVEAPADSKRLEAFQASKAPTIPTLKNFEARVLRRRSISLAICDVMDKLEEEHPGVKFDALLKDLPTKHIGMVNYHGYICYLNTMCQKMARTNRHDDALGGIPQERSTFATTAAYQEVVKLQLLARGVVNELRSNKQPNEKLMRALEAQWGAQHEVRNSDGSTTKEPLLDHPGGQQDTAEVLTRFHVLTGIEPPTVRIQKSFRYRPVEEDVGQPERKFKEAFDSAMGLKRPMPYYTGKTTPSNFLNVLTAYPEAHESTEDIIQESGAPERREIFSVPSGAHALGVQQALNAQLIDVKEVDDDPIADQPINTPRYDQMVVIVSDAEGNAVDSFTHERWAKQGLDKLNTAELKARFGDKTLTVCQRVQEEREILEAPERLEFHYMREARAVKGGDLYIEIEVKGERVRYELEGVVWRNGGLTGGGGHYYYMQKQARNKWQRYNDRSVSEIDNRQMMADCGQGSGCGRALIYRRVKRS